MAISQKLVFSAQSATDLIKPGGLLVNYTSDENQFYRSIVFTQDGKIITHGIIYNTLTGEGIDLDNLITSVATGGSTHDISLSVTNHVLTAALKAVYSTAPNLKGSLTGYILKTPVVTVDLYGRVTNLTESADTHLDYVTSNQAAPNTTYYLLGHNGVGTNSTVLNSNVKVTLSDDATPVATLFSPNLSIPTTDNILLSNNGTNETLTKYISTEINKIATSAMVFKDADTVANIIAKTITDTVNGDTYKITTGGELPGTKSSDGASHTLVTGDVLIAVVSENSLKWAFVPSGDDDVVIDVQVDNTSKKTSGIVTLGNAALSSVLSGQIADNADSSNLTTAAEVATYVANYVSGLNKSYINQVGDGLLLEDNLTGQTLSLNLADSKLNALDFASLTTAYAISLSKDKKLMVDLSGTKLVFGASDSAASNADISASDTQNIYMNLVAPSSAVTSLQFKQGSGISLSTDSKGILTISNSGIITASVTPVLIDDNSYRYKIGTISINGTPETLYGHDTNTWRPILAYDISNPRVIDKDSMPESTGTNILAFGAEFGYTNDDTTLNGTTAELHLVWAEIDTSGKITYHV